MELLNLDTGAAVSHAADPPFSGGAQLLSDLAVAEDALRRSMRQVGVGRSFFKPRTALLVQQLEGTDGDMSRIEFQALRCLGEMAGIQTVYISVDARPLDRDAALAGFKDRPRHLP